MSPKAGAGRLVPHVAPAIIPATDLGGVSVLKQGGTFLVSDASGDVVPDARGLGLYLDDTRFLSRLVLLVGGSRPTVLHRVAAGADRGTVVLTNPEPASPEGRVARGSLGIVREVALGGGLRERLSLTNHGDDLAIPTVDLLVDTDMADIFEVRGFVRARRGRFEPTTIDDGAAAIEYEGLDGRRYRTLLRAEGGSIEPATVDAGGGLRIRWRPAIEPGARVTLTWSISAETVDDGGSAEDGKAEGAGDLPAPHAIAGVTVTAIASDSPSFDGVIARGIADLDLLVTPGPGPGQRFLAAGIPWFTALFGRDAILAAFGALLVDPAIAVDTLRVLASLQATVDDPARDAEPGKIPHEVRCGEMARTGEVPFGLYYGSADATPLWLVLLGETFDWTGDIGLLEDLWPHALAALEWLDRHGDLDGDGFVEYRRRSPEGLVHHGWKDAADSVRDRDGRIAEGPIALAEIQGYAYDARVRTARLARALGDETLARRLEHAAARLRARFDDAFWVQDRESYALALDGRKRPMDAIASNQGHALWSGIVSDAHAAAVAGHLRGTGLDSGWGLRTYAAGQRGYNPIGYHTGTVWPHDTAIAVAGLQRAGFGLEATRLAGELFEAALTFPDARLPELFCGFGRDEVGSPVPYPVACSPQAWAAAAPLMSVRALLGIRPNALERRLDIERPMLPEGLRSLTLTGLRVGEARVDLRFLRRRGSTRVEVTGLRGELTVSAR